MADSNPTTQLIDRRIVSLLGLQYDLELSHEDYFRSLKEAALAARMSVGKFSSEEVSLITEELKRVRKEDKNIKFQTEKRKVKAKPKNQKVSSKTKSRSTTPKANTKVTSLSTFVQQEPKSTVTEPKSPPQATPTVPLLPQPKKKTVEVKEKKQKIKKEDCCEILGKKLTKIDSTLGSIFSTLKDQFSLRKKDSERERRGREKTGREDAENKLEKGSGIKEIVSIAKNLLSPFQDIFDRIKRFIVFTLLGKAFTMFMDWMKDPKNRQTFNTIVKFLTDHWVLIVGSYMLFGTRLGGLVRFVSKLVVKMAVKAVVATGKLIAVLAKSKWGRVALAAGAATAGAVAISQSGKKKDDKQDVESYAKGGIIGGIGNALKFTPLGMAFEAGKHGAKAVGKVASGATDFLGKGLKKSLDIASLPLTIGFKGLAGASEFLMNGLKSLDLLKLLAAPIQSITKRGGDKDPKLQAAGGIPGLIGSIVQKTSEGIGKNVKDSKKSKPEGKTKGAGYAKGGLINPLTMGLMGATPGLGTFAPLLAPLLQSKKIGGDHGLPVSGAGKDDRLLKLRTGDAILTEKDQNQLSSGNFLEKFGGPMGAMASFFSGKKSGEETVVAAKKGEAVVTQEDQLNILEKTGISIPSLLSGRKANKVSSDQLKTKSGVRLPGFFNGGIVQGFAAGGIVGKDAGYANTRYNEILQQTERGKIKSYNAKHGEGAYEKKLLSKLNKIHAPESLKQFGVNVNVKRGNEKANRKALAAKRPWWDKAGLFGDEASKAFGDIFENPDLKNPLHQKVAFGDMTYAQFKKEYLGQNKKSTSPKPNAFSRVLPKIGNAVGSLSGAFSSFNAPFTSGLLPKIGDAAKSVISSFGKKENSKLQSTSGYYSSSDQKTYGSYNDALEAKKSRMTSLASQQGLDKLSYAGASRNTSKGVRIDAESKVRGQEVKNRGGAWGQISRGWMNAFGSDKDRQNIKAQNAASQAKIKQSGAASIGRYYSSSDGKYYKDYAAADAARKVRLAAAPKPAAPKPAVAGGGMGGRRGGTVKKKEGGGLVQKSISEQLNTLRGIRANSLERQGDKKGAYGLRGFNLQDAFKNFSTNDIFKKSKYSFNLDDSFKNYFDNRKNSSNTKPFSKKSNIPSKPNPFGQNFNLNLNPIKSNYQLSKSLNNKNLVKTAFDPNTNLNTQKPKKQSISDTLKELREMRARSLDRQGDTLGALGVRGSNYNFPKIDANKLQIDPKKSYGMDLKIDTPKLNTDVQFKPLSPVAPAPPKIDPSEIQKKAGGGIVNKVKSGISGISGYFQQNKKRDLAKKAVSKVTSKGDAIKSNAEHYTNKPKKNKKGFWGGIYDTVSTINTGVKTAKGFIKKINPVNSATNAANFIGGNVKKLSNAVGKKGSDILSAAAQNPKMLKVGGAFSKFGGRMIPGLGVAASATDAAARAERGDKWGSALAGLGAGAGAATIATSGAAATGVGAVVPAVAEAVSMGADVGLLGKDLWDIMSSNEDNSSKKNKTTIRQGEKTPFKNSITGKINMMQGGGPIIPSVPSPPSIDPATGLPIQFTTDAPPPPKLISTPSTSLAPIKKSMMQRQADELRAMRANSVERQGRTSESYGLKAFGTGKDFSSSFFAKGNVMENTGINMPGGTADRQLTALQPGEYVIPKQTVNAFGGANFFDNMVAKTDSDSNAAKLGAKSKSNVGGGIKPYPINNSKKPQITNLGSAKEARSGAQRSQKSTPNGSSKEVFFEALCLEGAAPSERQRIMDLLGVNS